MGLRECVHKLMAGYRALGAFTADVHEDGTAFAAPERLIHPVTLVPVDLTRCHIRTKMIKDCLQEEEQNDP